MVGMDRRAARLGMPFLLLACSIALAGAEDPPSVAGTPKIATGSSIIDLDQVREPDPRFVIGYHQAGASSAESHGHFFTNFFVERHLWNPAWRLWGNVTVASYPQQISSPVGELIGGLAEQYASLPVNQVAQSAEFQTGIERLLRAWDVDKGEPGTDGHRIRTFGFIAGFGATGPLNPAENVQVFAVPPSASLQYPGLISKYPQLANAKYVGFTTPDRDRFYRQYSAGIRVSTYINSTEQHLAPPATYEVTLGQDEAITGGLMRGVVARFNCFYPLPLPGNLSDVSDRYRFLYLFGTASLRVGRGQNQQPFILEPATDVKGYMPDVALIATRSNRDTYRLGIGIDFINLFKSMKKQSPPTAAAAPASPTPAGAVANLR